MAHTHTAHLYGGGEDGGGGFNWKTSSNPMVLTAASDDFSSGEIRFDGRYFFRHLLRIVAATAATADHRWPPFYYIPRPTCHFLCPFFPTLSSSCILLCYCYNIPIAVHCWQSATVLHVYNIFISSLVRILFLYDYYNNMSIRVRAV